MEQFPNINGRLIYEFPYREYFLVERIERKSLGGTTVLYRPRTLAKISGLIQNSRNFWTCLFSKHAYFQSMLIQNFQEF